MIAVCEDNYENDYVDEYETLKQIVTVGAYDIFLDIWDPTPNMGWTAKDAFCGIVDKDVNVYTDTEFLKEVGRHVGITEIIL